MEPKVIEIAKNEVCKLSLIIYKENDTAKGYFKLSSDFFDDGDLEEGDYYVDASLYFKDKDLNKALAKFQNISARLWERSLKALEKRFPREHQNVIGRS